MSIPPAQPVVMIMFLCGLYDTDCCDNDTDNCHYNTDYGFPHHIFCLSLYFPLVSLHEYSLSEVNKSIHKQKICSVYFSEKGVRKILWGKRLFYVGISCNEQLNSLKSQSNGCKTNTHMI